MSTATAPHAEPNAISTVRQRLTPLSPVQMVDRDAPLLTPRQWEVLRAVCRNGRYKDAGPKVWLSPHTVKNYIREIKIRLGVDSTCQCCYVLGQADERGRNQ
jgi:DNA-binding NarL/FixJ family response regulator